MKKTTSKINFKKYFEGYDWKIKIKVITFVILLLLILTDQLIKFWVTKNFNINEKKDFLPGFIGIKYVINYGSAFGFNDHKTVLLIVFAFLIAFGLLGWWIFSKSIINIIGIVFIIAGTIGNLIDRFLNNGGVVDFLEWQLFEPRTIFNIADIFISIGIIIVIVTLIIETIRGIVNDGIEKDVKQEHEKHQVRDMQQEQEHGEQQVRDMQQEQEHGEQTGKVHFSLSINSRIKTW